MIWYEQFTRPANTNPTCDSPTFNRSFSKWVRKLASSRNWDVELTPGYYYCSGFFTNRATGAVVYFNTGDFRYRIQNSILVRSAQHTKDYTGGINQYVSYLVHAYFVRGFVSKVESIMKGSSK